MKTSTITFATAVIIAACTASKKTTTSTASSSTTAAAATTTAAVNTTTVATNEAPSFMFMKPADGIYSPGSEELIAAQTRYKDVTLDKLKEGYFIYALDACIKCHGAVNIYHIDPFRWESILDNMAARTTITPSQKEAVYQYVLAIKATKPK